VDDCHLTLVDGRKAIPMAVWVTHPFWCARIGEAIGLGTGGHPVPSVTKVIHSLSVRCGVRVKSRHEPVESAR
jgi:hypothetical protein